MSYLTPYKRLVNNTDETKAVSLVGLPDQDLPVNLVNRVNIPGNKFPFLAAQMWRERDDKGQEYNHPAKSTSLIPYANPLAPSSGANYGVNALNTVSTVTWEIPTWSAILERLYLEVTITATGAAVTPAPFNTWFTDFRVYTDSATSQGVILGMGGTTTGIYEYIDYGMERSDEERAILQSVTGIAEPTFDPIALVGGETQTYWMRISGWWEVVPYPFDVTKYFNVQFTNDLADNFITGAGVALVELISWRLIVETRQVSDRVYKGLRAAYVGDATMNPPIEGGLSVRWMEHIGETQSRSMAASTTQAFNLVNLRGLTTQLDIAVFPGTAMASNRVTMIDAFETILLQDTGSQAILGQSPIRTDFLTTQQIIENQLYSRMPTTTNHWFYPIMFGDGGWVGLKHRHMAISGYQSLKSNIVICTTRSTLATATYRILFLCKQIITLEFAPQGDGRCRMTVTRF
jgi:hypothetical protein